MSYLRGCAGGGRGLYALWVVYIVVCVGGFVVCVTAVSLTSPIRLCIRVTLRSSVAWRLDWPIRISAGVSPLAMCVRLSCLVWAGRGGVGCVVEWSGGGGGCMSTACVVIVVQIVFPVGVGHFCIQSIRVFRVIVVCVSLGLGGWLWWGDFVFPWGGYWVFSVGRPMALRVESEPDLSRPSWRTRVTLRTMGVAPSTITNVIPRLLWRHRTGTHPLTTKHLLLLSPNPTGCLTLPWRWWRNCSTISIEHMSGSPMVTEPMSPSRSASSDSTN